MIRTVTFYRTVEGKYPVKEFLDSLPGKHAQKVVWVLQLIEDLDDIPSSYLKKLKGTDEIWECRIQFGSNIYRILGFLGNGSTLVLTHGFSKKSRKISRGEIEKAEAYKKDYLKRRNKHE